MKSKREWAVLQASIIPFLRLNPLQSLFLPRYFGSKIKVIKPPAVVIDKVSDLEVSRENTLLGTPGAWYRKRRIREALNQMYDLEKMGIWPDSVAYACLIRRCIKSNRTADGKTVHDHIVKSGMENDLLVANHLIAMYRQFKNPENARRVFNRMSKRDVISWTSLIITYIENRNDKEALRLFCSMDVDNVVPDHVTFLTMLKAFSGPECLACGRMVHALLFLHELEASIELDTAFVKMYSKCGDLLEARRMFDNMKIKDTSSWNAIIGAYASYGFSKEALKLLIQMLSDGLIPNSESFVCILGAPIHSTEGRMVHATVLDSGLEFDILIGTALVDMYGKYGSLFDAERIFLKMQDVNVDSWTAMIMAYAKHGHPHKALHLFRQMQLEGVKPSKTTFVNILDACGSLEDLMVGQSIHARIVDNGFDLEPTIQNALLNMYCKCGSLKQARNMFEKIHARDIIAWNAMIAAYSRLGHSDEAFKLYRKMQEEGTKPDSITFICILFACSHSGLTEAGRQYFDAMRKDYNIEPALEHYACMVDLLGRAGKLEDAENFIHKMPLQPDATIWKILLNFCNVHDDTERAKTAAKQLKLCSRESVTYT